MAQESGRASIHEALHSYLTSNGIETAEKFFEGGQDHGYWMTHGMGRISELVTVDEFKTYEPLITYILLNQAQSDQEILQLINKKHSEPPTPPVSAPVSTGNILSGLIDSSAADFVPILERELEELLYTNGQGLLEHFIDPRHIDPTHRKRTNARSVFIDEKRQESDTLQGSRLRYISSFAAHLVNQTTPKNPMSRIWRTRPHTRLEGVDGTRMVDGAIMSGVNATQQTYHIRDVLVPFALKKDKQDLTKAVIGLGKYIWQFDRSGAIGSEPVDFKSDKPKIEKFLDLMLCFLTCNKELLGFDPTFIEAQDRPAVLRIKPQNDVNQELEIEPRPVFRASGICGRATTCWKAHPSGDKSQEFLIKDSWQPEQRPKEGEMLRIVTEKKVPHVARYHHHEDVCVDGKMVDIKSHLRRGVDFQNSHLDSWFSASSVGGLEGCIIGHQALFAAGYLHRDISVNNLMVNDQADDPHYRSFIIDLDGAIHRSMSNGDDRHTRTGTKVFMSISLLRGRNPPHSPDPKHLAGIKNEYLTVPRDLTNSFTAQYRGKHLSDCVIRFAQLMSNQKIRGWEYQRLMKKY
ncbi:hypothetical protein PGTUg99_004198 [Puccinia graminis f. sp. tritici]|uniref:Fungal-type protein kinase domain-containing protein n=1 Tax=Puccinia graminis f. sp. tritici TaxID=56615 RepID=A0A5B0SG11_PUCGR|nr:hypothetical protein PGTUg99_004198 [Puccinia graminis f. sp. tritici]